MSSQTPVLVRRIGSGEYCWQDGTTQGSGDAVALAAALGARSFWLAADSQAVRLLETPRPHPRRDLCLRGLPYALEEQFASDVDSLHFASGPLTDPLTCAVLARETLDGWLQALADVGLHPARVIPEALLLPWPDEEGWSLWLTGERAVLRHAPLAGFACPRAALPALLACVLAEAPAAPPRLFVWGETAPALGLECVPVAGHPFEAAAGAPAPIDLLQGAYARRPSWQAHWRRWRLLAIVALLWLILRLGLMGWALQQLTAEQTRLDAAMTDVYRAAVPGAVRVVDARLQLEQQLRARLAAQQAPQDLFTRLARVTPALTALPEIEVQSLQYRDGRLELELRAARLEAFASLRSQLDTAPGLAVQLSTGLRDGRAQARLSLGGPDS